MLDHLLKKVQVGYRPNQLEINQWQTAVLQSCAVYISNMVL